jgi:serine/threonine-protein kinase RsbT
MKLIYEVPGNDFDRAGEASARVKKALQRLGVPADVVRRVAIGTYEGEMNALIHAGGGIVQADINTESTVITVRDKGPGIADVKQAMQEGFSTAPDYVRALGFGAGMGLPNMIKCSDKFAIDTVINRGTKITMSFEHKHS